MGQSKEYPSIRKAVLGKSENGVANLWCGVKWLLWQATYVAIGLVIAVLGAIFLPIILGAKFFKGGRLESLLSWAADKIYNFVTHDYVSTGVRWTLEAGVIGTLVGIVGALVYGLATFPEKTLMAVGFFTVVVLVLIAGVLIVNLVEWVANAIARRFSSVQEKSKDSPVARRFVGYCPVSMDITPKWFEKIFKP